MALHLKRTETSNDKHHSSFKGARISSWEPPAHNKSVLEIQHYPNPTVLQNVPDSKNTLIPPPHWHWYQQEYFNIKFGYAPLPLQSLLYRQRSVLREGLAELRLAFLLQS